MKHTDHLELFLSRMQPQTVRNFEATRKIVEEYFKKDIITVLRKKKADDISRFALHLTAPIKKGGRGNTVNTAHTRIKWLVQLSTFLIDYEVIETNYAATARRRMPKKTEANVRPTRAVDPDTVTTLIDTAPSKCFRALLALLFYCGLRRSEPLKLERRDFSTKKGTLYVTFRKTKNGKDIVKALPPEAVPYVKEWLAECTTTKLFDFSVETLYRFYKSHVGQAPHSARATACTLLLNKGFRNEDIATYLGQSTTTMVKLYDKRENVSDELAKGMTYGSQKTMG